MKSVLLGLVLFVSAGVLLAQSNQAQNEKSGNQSAQQGNVQTIRGCLTTSGHTYIILGNNPMRQYRVTGGDMAALKHLVNHTVEVTGPVGHVKSGASEGGNYGPASTTGVGYDTVRAQSVKNASDNCGLGG